MDINPRVVFFAIIAFFVAYVVYKFNILSSIITSGVVGFLGYVLLYKCCSVICEKRKMDLDEMIEEYKINGITRIILETFKIFAEKVYFLVLKYNFIEVFFKGFLYQKDEKKPIMKEDKNRDKVLLFEYLVNLLDKNEDENTAGFKQAVESIWQDKWSFFAHSGYVGNLLKNIGDFCYENNLPIITFLITYSDGTLAKGAFQDSWKNGENGWEKAGLMQDYKANFKEFKKYLQLMLKNKDKYKTLLAEYKKHLNYGE